MELTKKQAVVLDLLSEYIENNTELLDFFSTRCIGVTTVLQALEQAFKKNAKFADHRSNPFLIFKD